MSQIASVGPYQIVGPLGAGGMGEVYKALDTRVGRQVALKILPESVARDEERRRRFEQEARLAAALNHPNLMAIYDVGLDQHPPYIVSELIPGESLRALTSKGPIPVRRAIGIAAQIADGLAAAHAAGIVHRDLKPENVMLTSEGAVKILDFGVARVEGKAAAAAGATMRDLPGLEPFSSGSPGLSAALTSDQKSIVYTVNRPRTEIWILDGLQVPAPWYRRMFMWK